DDQDLLSLDETEAIRQKAKSRSERPSGRTEIPFSEKGGARFQAVVGRLHDANNSSVYVWQPLANVCGLLRPVSLDEVEFAFEYDLNPEGIVVVLTTDLVDKLLLDYSVDASNRQMLEIELSGRNWGAVRY